MRQAYDYWQDQPGSYLIELKKSHSCLSKVARTTTLIHNPKAESHSRLCCRCSNGQPICKHWLTSHDSLPSFSQCQYRECKSGISLFSSNLTLRSNKALMPARQDCPFRLAQSRPTKQLEICLHIVYYAQTPLAFAAAQRQQQKASDCSLAHH